MAMDETTVRERLTQVFARQDFLEACKRRDAGAIVRILGVHGITQGQINMMTGIAQSTLSKYKTGGHQAEFASTFEKIADGLGMPQRLRQALGLTGDSTPDRSVGATNGAAGVPADTFDLIRFAEVIGRNGRNVKRREMLSLAAGLGGVAAVAQSEVWERLAYALTNQTATNEAIVREMEARSAGFHRLEEIVSAPQLLKGLTVQLREVSTLLGGTASDPKDELRKRLLVVAGESSVLAGWAASDMGDSATARNFYETAAKAAKEAKDPEIIACALAYRSYVPSAKGANGRSRVLLAEALEILPRNSSSGTLAWLSARHAEESAYLGESEQALTSWARAEEAYGVADTDDDRVWTGFLDQNRFDSYRISTLAKIGRLEEAHEVAATLLTRLSHPDRKKAAIIFEDMATAYLARGAVSEASKLAKSGLAILRETEFTMWLPRYERIAQALVQQNRQPAVRAYLEDFAMTKRQFASQQ
jgi:transcriptional regulator with XRE-family HTH domain/tetratricopeptide (TPR) repeat protein